MKLQELRESWEHGGKAILCVTHNETLGVNKATMQAVSHKTLYVIVHFAMYEDSYSLHRYFQVFDEWYVSVDVRASDSIIPCLTKITQDFNNLMPVNA